MDGHLIKLIIKIYSPEKWSICRKVIKPNGFLVNYIFGVSQDMNFTDTWASRIVLV